MKIIYKCPCMKDEREIEVTDRVQGGDVLTWMNLVQMSIGYDHGARNGLCMAEKTEYVKIPLDGNEIGVPPTKQ